MIVIACVDDNMGMMFNNRRQSRDVVVVERILEISKGHNLWMSKYSFELFKDFDCGSINVEEMLMSETPQGDYCFLEDKKLYPYEKWVEKVILFKWNRNYPYDKQFDGINLNSWKLVESEEFVGSSHDKITMEVYVR